MMGANYRVQMFADSSDGFRRKVSETPGNYNFKKPATSESELSKSEFEELSYDEQREREQLERLVERTFYESGKGLRTLRDKRLYRSTHNSFEEYCKDRFGFERRQPYRLIEAAGVMDNLVEMCPTQTPDEYEICLSQSYLPRNIKSDLWLGLMRLSNSLCGKKQWKHLGVKFQRTKL